MMLSLDDRGVKWGLHLLLYTAAETLFDGTYYLDGRTRRSPKVIEAARVLFDLSQALPRLLDDTAELARRLAEIARVFDELETLDVSVIHLMVHRDYATEQQNRRTAAARIREGRSPRWLLRLVSDDERS